MLPNEVQFARPSSCLEEWGVDSQQTYCVNRVYELVVGILGKETPK